MLLLRSVDKSLTLHQYQGEKTSEMHKQLLLPIKLGRIVSFCSEWKTFKAFVKMWNTEDAHVRLYRSKLICEMQKTEQVWLVWLNGESLFSVKRTWQSLQLTYLWFAMYLNKPQDFWNNGTMAKVEMFGHNALQHVWWKPNTASQHKHLTPIVKHGGGKLMIWAYFASTGSGQLTVIELIMNSSVYQSILESNGSCI